MQTRPFCRPLTPKETHSAPEMPTPVCTTASHSTTASPSPHTHHTEKSSHRSPPRKVVRTILRSPHSRSHSPSATPCFLGERQASRQLPQQRPPSAYEAALEAYGQELHGMVKQKRQTEAHHRREVLSRQREVHKRYSELSRPRSARVPQNAAEAHGRPVAEIKVAAKRELAGGVDAKTGSTTAQRRVTTEAAQLEILKKLLFGVESPSTAQECKRVEQVERCQCAEVSHKPDESCSRNASTQTNEEREPPQLTKGTAIIEGVCGGIGPSPTVPLMKAPRPLLHFLPKENSGGFVFIHPQQKPRPLRRHSDAAVGDFLHLREPARRSVGGQTYKSVVPPYVIDSFALRHLMRAAWMQWRSRLRERRVFVKNCTNPKWYGVPPMLEECGGGLAQPVTLRSSPDAHPYSPRRAGHLGPLGHCKENGNNSCRSLSTELAAGWEELLS